jgi:hypothetical protein
MRARVRHAVWIAVSLTLTAACIGGQSGSPGSAPRADAGASADAGCNLGPLAPTALRVRGQDLWDAFCGEYKVEVRRSRLVDGRNIEDPNATVTLKLEPSDAHVDQARVCDQVAVPVRVEVESSDGSLDEAFVGSLFGVPPNGYVNFGSSLTRGDTDPHIDGVLRFDPEPQTVSISSHVRKLDTAWTFERGKVP